MMLLSTMNNNTSFSSRSSLELDVDIFHTTPLEPDSDFDFEVPVGMEGEIFWTSLLVSSSDSYLDLLLMILVKLNKIINK